jgi:hypothetical protein
VPVPVLDGVQDIVREDVTVLEAEGVTERVRVAVPVFEGVQLFVRLEVGVPVGVAVTASTCGLRRSRRTTDSTTTSLQGANGHLIVS